MKRERREFQRFHLDEPIEARFGEQPVRLVEIGISGARLEHPDRQPVGRVDRLAFEWKGDSHALHAEVVRSTLAPSAAETDAEAVHHSGVFFVGAAEAAGDALRRALSAAVIQRLEQRKVHPILVELRDYDDTLRPDDAMFVSYVQEDGVWKKRRAFLPEQPEVGFTVALNEDKDELQRLCRAYEQADEEGRRLIRLFCELSISDAMNVPRAQ
ncbi:MAG: hypothetical protein ACRD2J_00905 [Thermoanaerobaculia bacterium]